MVGYAIFLDTQVFEVARLRVVRMVWPCASRPAKAHADE
jgi:hypothetical protein